MKIKGFLYTYLPLSTTWLPSIDFLLVFFVRLFVCEVVDNFTGTVSNVKQYETSKHCTKFGAYLKK